MKNNYFQILGVNAKATLQEIKHAYREKAKFAHPDHGGSEEEMKLLNIAYAVLSSPELSEVYKEEMYENNGKSPTFDNTFNIFSYRKGQAKYFTVNNDKADEKLYYCMTAHIINFYKNHKLYDLDMDFEEFRYKYYHYIVKNEITDYVSKIMLEDVQIDLSDKTILPIYKEVGRALHVCEQGLENI